MQIHSTTNTYGISGIDDDVSMAQQQLDNIGIPSVARYVQWSVAVLQVDQRMHCACFNKKKVLPYDCCDARAVLALLAPASKGGSRVSCGFLYSDGLRWWSRLWRGSSGMLHIQMKTRMKQKERNHKAKLRWKIFRMLFPVHTSAIRSFDYDVRNSWNVVKLKVSSYCRFINYTKIPK